jgi:hypothetical protein
VEEDDIPDILQKWPKREEGTHSFRVDRKELSQFGNVLTPGRYREQQAEAVKHDTPADIVKDVLKVEEKIAAKLRGLQKQLARK